ncbi:MAG: alpha-glucosidase [Azospirillum sp.]|nr:alpha-glucosidase [Azospirillum sp.]
MAEWWRGAVIYQIYPRSFMDSNGDGIGDLRGIESRLDYVAGLGVDGIWLSPFFKSPMKDFGYDVEDYCAVDPIFGSLADCDRLIAAAHCRSLKVIIDLVLSHTSDRHPWFQDSRACRAGQHADWYVWAEPRTDGTPPNNWLSVFGGSAWTWNARRGQYYLHNFLDSQPDLNLHQPAVQEAVLGVARFWLERGVDGFRLDVANYYMHDPLLRDNPARPRDAGVADGVPLANPYALQWHRYDKSRPETLGFLRRLRAVMDEFPGTMTVAEVHDDDSIARSAEYVAGEERLHTAYSFALLTERFSAGVIRGSLEAFARQPGNGWPAWAFGNHDVVRAVSRWGGPVPAPALAKLLIALLGCLRGTGFLYQGDELGLPEAEVPFERLQDPFGRAFWPEFKGRDGCRTPIPWDADLPQGGFSRGEPWLPLPAAHLGCAVAGQDRQPDSVLGFTRRFLAWRRGHDALRLGEIVFHAAPEPVLIFERRHQGRAVLAVFNLSPAPVPLPAPPPPSSGAGAWSAVAGLGTIDPVAGRGWTLPGYGVGLATSCCAAQ